MAGDFIVVSRATILSASCEQGGNKQNELIVLQQNGYHYCGKFSSSKAWCSGHESVIANRLAACNTLDHPLFIPNDIDMSTWL